MKKVGVVVAIEIDSVLARYGDPLKIEDKHGFAVRIYQNANCELLVVDSGVGEIAAATATQMLIDEYEVDLILNFGVVGALTEEISTAELCVVERVVHYDFDTEGWINLIRGQYPGRDSVYFETTRSLVDLAVKVKPTLKRVTCASADKFVSDPDRKRELAKLYDADICEMEAAGVIITALRNGVEVLSVKAISDSLLGGGREFLSEVKRVSCICFDVVDKIIQNL